MAEPRLLCYSVDQYMRYFVLTQGGLYGPAEIGQIQQWAQEGRLDASTVLEEEGSRRRIMASSLPGLSFTTFQNAPSGSPVVAPAPIPQSPPGEAMKPNPPQLVSNYRRPDYVPPLFLAKEVDGKRELLYSFIFAAAAPVIALLFIYGIAMAIGGVYCAALAIQRGQKLGVLSLVLNLVALPLALYLHFGLRWLF